MWEFQPHGKAIYFSALLLSASLWPLPLLVLARVMAGERGAWRVAAAALSALWVLGLAVGSYGGQLVYYRFFRSYAGRDTLRLGALVHHGSIRSWFEDWSAPHDALVCLAAGTAVTFGLLVIARRVGPRLTGRWPVVTVVVFPAALGVAWADQIDSRYLQASTPDVSLVHSLVHWLRAATTGAGDVPQGMTLRIPEPLPPLVSARPRRPSVFVILTESVRADAMCSDPPPRCEAPFLDAVAADRLPLGLLTAQTPNTFSASMVLWTGLEPSVDIVSAHEAPTLWELARAVGYRTAYVTSQDAKYEDFGTFVRRAGIDEIVTATELGGMEHEHLGAPDERATDRALAFVRATPAGDPYFVLVQLSNTHHPYRVDPALTPFSPLSDDPGDLPRYRNRYRDSVRLQERLVASVVRELRATPAWNDTVILFLSDHGEPLAQHRYMHHNHTLFDEELRVPGWLLAGPQALTADERAAVGTYAGVRTYTQDVNATAQDLLGVLGERASLPLADRMHGRSLLRPRVDEEPVALLGTSTGVWEPNDPWFGAMTGQAKLVGAPRHPWACFDLVKDPAERSPRPSSECGALEAAADLAFPGKVP